MCLNDSVTGWHPWGRGHLCSYQGALCPGIFTTCHVCHRVCGWWRRQENRDHWGYSYIPKLDFTAGQRHFCYDIPWFIQAVTSSKKILEAYFLTDEGKRSTVYPSTLKIAAAPLDERDVLDWPRPTIKIGKGKNHKREPISPATALWMITGDCGECSGSCGDNCSWTAAPVAPVWVCFFKH